MFFMDEFAKCTLRHCSVITFNVSCPSSEKFLKIKCRIFYVIKSSKNFTQVKRENVKPRKPRIRIRISEVI
ncbi:unknown [Alistipes sp. CAG:514]|nr:unknown [Alistipes sp. CAG:514]